MSKGRDIIKEIIAKRTRLKKGSNRWEQFRIRNWAQREALNYIKANIKGTPDFKYELLRYFPIGAIAIIEGYFRLAIRDIIDFGEPYLSNVEKIKDIRFTARNVLAIYGERITLGELISHFLSLNSLEDINNYLSILLDLDFLQELSKFRFDLDGKKTSMEKSAPGIFEEVKEAFRLRHIYCHEIAIKEKLGLRKIHGLRISVFFFVYIAELFINSFLLMKKKKKK